MTEAALPPELRALVRETPLVACAPLGCLLKLESEQETRSFKLRGAVLALAALHARGVRRVVAASAGNHGLGVAKAAQALGVEATVVVPASAARVKRDEIAALGARLVEGGPDYDAAEAHAKALSADGGVPFVSPYDDEDVMEGNGGWLARELLAQHPAVDRVVVPVGGGGLVGGLLRALAPRGVEVIGVQPQGACAMARSLAEGAPRLTDDGHTVCSGLDGGVSERTYRVAAEHDLEIVLVQEHEVLPAMAWCRDALRLTVEPASAVVIVAARRGRFPLDEDTVLVLTGGNV